VSDSSYERLGGEAKLRAIMADFVDRVFADIMIGFFFRDATKARIAELEFQHAAEHLGAGIAYRGRPLGRAHAAHPILAGHFDRRLQLLREVLAEHGVPEDIARAWLAHDEHLRGEVMRNPRGQCNDV
jgi:hemoglobin